MILNSSGYPILDNSNTRVLNDVEKKELICSTKHKKEFTNYNGSIYHVKRKNLSLLLNELIGEIISEYYDLATIKSTIYIDKRSEIEGVCVLLSKLFTNSKEKYQYFKYLFSGIYIDDSTGLDNLNRLESFIEIVDCKCIVKQIDKVSLKKLLEDLKKMIIRDFMTEQHDRNGANFLFRINNTKVDLMPVYDYEYSFGYGREFSKYFGIFDMNLELDNVIDLLKQDSYFQELLTKSMDLDINSLIELCEERHNIRISGPKRELYEYYIDKAKKKILDYSLIK